MGASASQEVLKANNATSIHDLMRIPPLHVAWLAYHTMADVEFPGYYADGVVVPIDSSPAMCYRNQVHP